MEKCRRPLYLRFSMTTSETDPLSQAPATPPPVGGCSALEGWPQALPEGQDPFVALAELDPADDWTAAATRWSERAMNSLSAGKELEVSFQDSFLRSLASSTGLVLWRQQASAQPSADPGLALLRENAVRRDSAAGLTHLHIPGRAISNLSTRVFAECRTVVGGQKVITKHHIVDLQIKTLVNKPIFTFSPEILEDGSKLRPIEPQGSWFRFPLEEVQLKLI